MLFMFFFSSRRRHTRFSRDWSSDVCSSDLLERGEWGVGVQSKFLAVGAVVPWAEPTVGAIATQAFANVAYGPEGLQLLRDGLLAPDVVARLTEADEGRDHRQLGIVDAEGGATTYTGSSCLEWAGGVIGKGYAAQGNILVSEQTVAADRKSTRLNSRHG